jgi:hypothetical protein
MQPWWSSLAGVVIGAALAWLATEHRSRRERTRLRTGYLEAIALDARYAAALADVYRTRGIKVPAYRAPLVGRSKAFPSLVEEGVLSEPEASTLAQSYADAESFNRCLDSAQKMLDGGRGDINAEVRREGLKASISGMIGSTRRCPSWASMSRPRRSND